MPKAVRFLVQLISSSNSTRTDTVTIKLYTYWRSSAAYRVRIALNLKQLEHELIPINLFKGEQKENAYRERNPQGLVPFLEDGAVAIGQSLAILEYLEETYPEPALLPAGIPERAAVRSFCNLICCDVHPLNNLRVLKYHGWRLDVQDDERDRWYGHWIHEAFRAIELQLEDRDGPYTFGQSVTLADLCLVPQVYNARRFKVPLDGYPQLVAVVDRCNELPAFQAAVPEKQPDSQ